MHRRGKILVMLERFPNNLLLNSALLRLDMFAYAYMRSFTFNIFERQLYKSFLSPK